MKIYGMRYLRTQGRQALGCWNKTCVKRYAALHTKQKNALVWDLVDLLALPFFSRLVLPRSLSLFDVGGRFVCLVTHRRFYYPMLLRWLRWMRVLSERRRHCRQRRELRCLFVSSFQRQVGQKDEGRSWRKDESF